MTYFVIWPRLLWQIQNLAANEKDLRHVVFDLEVYSRDRFNLRLGASDNRAPSRSRLR